MKCIFRRKGIPDLTTQVDAAYVVMTATEVRGFDYLGDDVGCIAEIRTSMFDTVYYYDNQGISYDELVLA